MQAEAIKHDSVMLSLVFLVLSGVSLQYSVSALPAKLSLEVTGEGLTSQPLSLAALQCS